MVAVQNRRRGQPGRAASSPAPRPSARPPGTSRGCPIILSTCSSSPADGRWHPIRPPRAGPWQHPSAPHDSPGSSRRHHLCTFCGFLSQGPCRSSVPAAAIPSPVGGVQTTPSPRPQSCLSSSQARLFSALILSSRLCFCAWTPYSCANTSWGAWLP